LTIIEGVHEMWFGGHLPSALQIADSCRHVVFLFGCLDRPDELSSRRHSKLVPIEKHAKRSHSHVHTKLQIFQERRIEKLGTIHNLCYEAGRLCVNFLGSA
jgi:hypothetical protein